MGGCLITAALLYVPVLSGLIGQRDVVKTVHEVCGFALPVPLIAGYLASRDLRSDVGRLNRFRPADWAWLRPRAQRFLLPVGKFNAGQKLYAAFVLGSVLVMLGTGIVLTFPDPFADALRTVATFTHDWWALALTLLILGHWYMAANDAEARRGMRTGVVRIEWARAEHSAWAAEAEAADTGPDASPSSPGPGAGSGSEPSPESDQGPRTS